MADSERNILPSLSATKPTGAISRPTCPSRSQCQLSLVCTQLPSRKIPRVRPSIPPAPVGVGPSGVLLAARCVSGIGLSIIVSPMRAMRRGTSCHTLPSHSFYPSPIFTSRIPIPKETLPLTHGAGILNLSERNIEIFPTLTMLGCSAGDAPFSARTLMAHRERRSSLQVDPALSLSLSCICSEGEHKSR